MRILKIKFKNINSLRGEHEIDFSVAPLVNSGLFAITGPTGSGKTTILDVITLALFNRVPRLNRNISKAIVANSGALLTRNTQEASAEVEYECSNGIFRSSWNISINRNGNLRDYDMEVYDINAGCHIDLKKGEVPAYNEDLIGLNYDQFVKSILLAQGEFAQFLKVNKSERGELLEKITGTGIYRELGRKAFEKKQIYARELEELRKTKSIISNNLLDEEILKGLTKEREDYSAEIRNFENNLKNVEAQLRLRQELDQLAKKRINLQTKLNNQKEILDQFDRQYGKRLKNHQATSAYAEMLTEYKQLSQTIDQNRKEVADLKDKIEGKNSSRQALIQNIYKFLNKSVDEKAIPDELENFRIEVEAIQQQLRDCSKEYQDLKKRYTEVAVNWKSDEISSDPELEHSQLQQRIKDTENKFRDIDTNLKSPSSDKLHELREELDKKIIAAEKGAHWDKFLSKHQNELIEVEAEGEKCRKNLKSLPEEISKLEKEEKNLESKEELTQLKIENQKLRQSLDEHRSQLTDGEPCPLCGSEHHPWAEHSPEVSLDLQQQLQDQKQKLKQVSTQLHELKNSKKVLENQLEVTNSKKVDLKKAISEFSTHLNEECSEWWSAGKSTDWDELIAGLNHSRSAMRDWELLFQQLKVMNSAIPLLEEMIELKGRGKKLRADYSARYAGENVSADCRKLSAELSHLLQQIDGLIEHQSKVGKNLKEHQDKLNKLNKELLHHLEDSPFENISEALNARMPDKEFMDLSENMSSLKQSLMSLQGEIKSVENDIQEKETDKSEMDDSAVLELHTQVKNEISSRQKDLEEVNRRLKNHFDFLKEVEALDKKIEAEEKQGKKWEILNHLIGDATGKTFNNFAQDLTLQQLLGLANRRLSQLNDRYRIASPTEEEDDSLIAIDDHMGGQRRSVKTLSGGETFVLSLSLALALSDLASRNISINSLFIDEGFGTLDPETLDQTLDTLERLQAESSKTIGIISHVEMLKERIGTQIQLVRNGQGYSSIKIV